MLFFSISSTSSIPSRMISICGYWKWRNDPQQNSSWQAWSHSDLEPAMWQLPIYAESFRGLRELLENLRAVTIEMCAFVRQRQHTGRAPEQHHTQIFFECLDRPTDNRRVDQQGA